MKKNRKAVTLVEILVWIAIIGVIAGLLLPVLAPFMPTKIIQVEVTEKWTDIDHNGIKIYRVRSTTPDGEVETWDSYWIHDDLKIGQSYKLNVANGVIKSIKEN